MGLAHISAAAMAVALLAQSPAPAKTADGQIDIQGYWAQRNNVTTYSLERGDEDRREDPPKPSARDDRGVSPPPGGPHPA